MQCQARVKQRYTNKQQTLELGGYTVRTTMEGVILGRLYCTTMEGVTLERLNRATLEDVTLERFYCTTLEGVILGRFYVYNHSI